MEGFEATALLSVVVHSTRAKLCLPSLPNRLFVKPCVSEWFVGPHITINISALPLLCTLKKKSLLVCAHEISSKHGNTAEVRTDV